jgi:hypothetical protein
MWINLLAGFFIFGACASGLAAFTLSWPGTPLDHIWVVNPQGHAGMAALGWLAVVGMAVLCTIMSATAIGLFSRHRWAWWSAAVVLTVNGLGDAAAVFIRRDPRSAIGVPIAGLILWWMTRPQVRAQFVRYRKRNG